MLRHHRGCEVPLDRLLSVGVRGIDDWNDAGILVPGPVTEYPIWATPLDISVTRNLETGGARLKSDRVFRVRWFPELAIAPVTSVSIIDELGQTYTVTKIEEFVGPYCDLRRRWLTLECTREGQTRT